jgi:uncharacterized protein (DUF1697 family)
VTRYAAFLRGVNLGKRTVKSAELKAAFEAMGFTNVKTLLASGNVLFDAKASKSLQDKIEAGLKEAFGFEIGTVLRSIDELAAMVDANPFGREEGEDAKLHVMLFAERMPASFKPRGIKDDFDVPKVTDREVYLLVLRKPDGTYIGNSGGLIALEKQLPKGTLVTSRNWNTILKATA